MKNNRHITFILLVIWVILAFVFGLYDLDISKQIADQNSGWAGFLEDYGMIPGILIVLSGIYIYYSYIKEKSDLWSYVKKIVFFLASTGLIFYLLNIINGNSIGDNFISNHFLTFLIAGFMVSILILIILHIKKSVQNIVAINYAKVVIGMALFGYLVFIQVVKFFWGRVRFRELDSSFSQFIPWYLPQGITGFDSFPSGHAAMGMILLSLIVLISNKKQLIKNSALVLICVWSIVLALSRVIIGAHYASDVLFGSFFIIITFLIFYRRFIHTN